jgi:hypothetical protein
MSVIMPMSEINGSRVFECRSGWRRSLPRLICVRRSLGGAGEKCAWWIHVRGVRFVFNEPTTRLNCGRYVRCVGFSSALTSRMQSISERPWGNAAAPAGSDLHAHAHAPLVRLLLINFATPWAEFIRRRIGDYYPQMCQYLLLCCCWWRWRSWQIYLVSWEETNDNFLYIMAQRKFKFGLLARRMCAPKSWWDNEMW